MSCNIFIKGYFSSKRIEETVSCYETLRKTGISKELYLSVEGFSVYFKTNCSLIEEKLNETVTNYIEKNCKNLTAVFEVKCWGKINNFDKNNIIETDNTLLIVHTIGNNVIKLSVINKNKVNKDNINKLIKNNYYVYNITKIQQTFDLGKFKSICKEINIALKD